MESRRKRERSTNLTETGLFFAFDFGIVLILYNDTNEVTSRASAAMAGDDVDGGGGGDGSTPCRAPGPSRQTPCWPLGAAMVLPAAARPGGC